MVDRTTASTHLRRLGSLPFFNAIPSAAFSEWITVAAKESDDGPHLVRAIDLLLRSKTLPQSPEDIVDAINGTRIHAQPAVTQTGEFCGRTVPGWFYLGHDPRLEITPAQERLEEDVPKVMLPSRCVRGWIHRTIWIPVVPARIDDNGNPIRQPYHSSGLCRCQPGGKL